MRNNIVAPVYLLPTFCDLDEINVTVARCSNWKYSASKMVTQKSIVFNTTDTYLQAHEPFEWDERMLQFTWSTLAASGACDATWNLFGNSAVVCAIHLYVVYTHIAVRCVCEIAWNVTQKCVNINIKTEREKETRRTDSCVVSANLSCHWSLSICVCIRVNNPFDFGWRSPQAHCRYTYLMVGTLAANRIYFEFGSTFLRMRILKSRGLNLLFSKCRFVFRINVQRFMQMLLGTTLFTCHWHAARHITSGFKTDHLRWIKIHCVSLQYDLDGKVYSFDLANRFSESRSVGLC